MIEDIFQAVTSHPALISSYYVYKDIIQGIFQVVTSHPALISSYYVYKDVIQGIFQVVTSHPALISSDISQLRLIIISQEINSLAYNNNQYSCCIQTLHHIFMFHIYTTSQTLLFIVQDIFWTQ